MRLIDLSPPVDPKLGVWPGDTPYSREILLALERGDSLTLSTIRSTVHLGSHADAPGHYQEGGAGIDERALDFYFGPCQVLDAEVGRGARILPEDLGGAEIQTPRILLRSGSFPDPRAWNEDFAALSPELVHHLHERGVRLVGIDTPSVDPQDDRELLSHHALAAHDMAILEGLALAHVRPGRYTLAAFPLRLVGCDASPVRAVLIAEDP